MIGGPASSNSIEGSRIGLAGEGGDLARDAEDRKPVGTIGRDGHLEDRVAEKIRERLTDWRFGRKFEDAFVVVREAELVLAHHHAGGLDAADDAGLELAELAAMTIAVGRAHLPEDDLLADGDVRRAADDALRARTGFHCHETQPVGVRMGVDGLHLGRTDLLAPISAGRVDLVDGEARLGELLGKFLRREVDVDVLSQPLQ